MLKEAFMVGFKKEAISENTKDKFKAMAHGSMGPPGTGMYEAKKSKNESPEDAANRGMLQAAIPTAAGMALGALAGGVAGKKMGESKLSKFSDDVAKVRNQGKIQNEADMLTDMMRSNRIEGANELSALNDTLKEIKHKKDVLKPLRNSGEEVEQAVSKLNKQERQVQEALAEKMDAVNLSKIKNDKIRKGIGTGTAVGVPTGGALGGLYASTQRPEN